MKIQHHTRILLCFHGKQQSQARLKKENGAVRARARVCVLWVCARKVVCGLSLSWGFNASLRGRRVFKGMGSVFVCVCEQCVCHWRAILQNPF
jgi:hypothetical protein